MKRKAVRKRRPKPSRVLILVGVLAAIITLIVLLIPKPDRRAEYSFMHFSYETQSVIIRDETAYYADFDFNNITFGAEEGGEVNAGDSLAVVYRLGYTEDIAQRLYDVQTKIYAMQTELLSGINNPEVTAAQERVLLLKNELASGESLRTKSELETELKAAMLRRNTLMRDVIQPTEELNTLYGEEELQKRRLDEWTSGRVVAQESGIFSCYSDNLEASLCMDKLDVLSSTQIKSALSGKGYSTASSNTNFMYRLVQPGSFCIAFNTGNKSNIRLVPGESYNVTFGSMGISYTGTCVKSFTSGDYCTNVIQIEADIGHLLTVRTAQVSITGDFEGARVKSSAIDYTSEGEPYVTFARGGEYEKIFIDILATDGNYAIIRETGSQTRLDGLNYKS